MDDTLSILLTFCPFLAFFCAIPLLGLLGMFVILQIGRQRTNDLHQAWIAFSQANGLNFEAGSLFVFPKLTGQYRGRPVTLTIYAAGRRRHYTTAITPLRVAPDVQLQVMDRMQIGYYFLTAQGPILTIGEPRFVGKYEVRGSSALAHRLLSPAIQTEILDSGISHLIIAKGELSLRHWGYQSQPEILRAMLELLVRAAEMAE